MKRPGWMMVCGAGVLMLGVGLGFGPDEVEVNEPAAVEPTVTESEPAPAEPITQPASEELPTPEVIFEKHLEAIGGREAAFAIKTRRSRGLWVGPPFAGPARMTLWQQAPNTMHMILADPLGMRYEIGHDGQTAWEVLPGGESDEITGDRKVEVVEMADFYGEANYKDRYKSTVTIGMYNIDKDTPCWIVDAESTSGRKRSLLFHAETGLFVAERVLVSHGEKHYIMQVRHSEYKDFGGVLWPTMQVQTIAKLEGYKVTITFKEWVTDEEEEHDFSQPPSMKIGG